MTNAIDFWECRHLGHSWDDIPVTKKPPFGVYLWFRCVRCTTERHDIIQGHSNGDLLSRKYHYPDGYKVQRDERPSIEELRVHQLKLGKRRRRGDQLRAKRLQKEGTRNAS